jgi:hypothetical protein
MVVTNLFLVFRSALRFIGPSQQLATGPYSQSDECIFLKRISVTCLSPLYDYVSHSLEVSQLQFCMYFVFPLCLKYEPHLFAPFNFITLKKSATGTIYEILHYIFSSST